MGISPEIEILTRPELQAKEDAAFHRGVARGKFEASSDKPEAIELLEQGASLFFGRLPDMSHMDTEDFRHAHAQWFERVSAFLKGLSTWPSKTPPANPAEIKKEAVPEGMVLVPRADLTALLCTYAANNSTIATAEYMRLKTLAAVQGGE